MIETATSRLAHSRNEASNAKEDRLIATPISSAAQRKLFAWLSPSFPVGGFSYSHGLEWAVEDGTVTSSDALQAWLADVLQHGAGWSDTVLFLHAHRAATADDGTALTEINELAIAFQPSKERTLESTAQGRAFLTTVVATWPNEHLTALATLFSNNAPITYPVAVALACAAHDIPPDSGAGAYLSAFVANLVSAAIRAIPLGQTEGQRVIAELSPRIEPLLAETASARLDMLGGSTWRADIASMKHETQYTRLFRS